VFSISLRVFGFTPRQHRRSAFSFVTDNNFESGASIKMNDSKKILYATDLAEEGKISEAITVYEEVVAETESGDHQYIAARELVRNFSSLFDEYPNFLVVGSNENKMIRYYLEIVIELNPLVDAQIRGDITFDSYKILQGFLENGVKD
jgi:hypothetical protein